MVKGAWFARFKLGATPAELSELRALETTIKVARQQRYNLINKVYSRQLYQDKTHGNPTNRD